MDMGIERKRAIIFVWTVGFVSGIPSAISIKFFGNQDWAWGIGLMLSGFFFALAVIIYGVKNFRSHLINQTGNDLNIGRWYDVIIKYIIPFEFVVLIVWWFWHSVSWSNNWWNPFETYSLGTCVFQWSIVILVFLIFNRQINKRIFKTEL